MNGDNHWHLDKKVPLFLIAAILMQTLTLGWFIRGGTETTKTNAARIDKVEAMAQARQEQVNNNTIAVAVINESLKNLQLTLDRIEDKLDK